MAKNLAIATDEFGNIRKMLKGRIDLTIQEEIPFSLRLAELGVESSKFERVLAIMSGEQKYGCMAIGKSSSPRLVHKLKAALNAEHNTRE